MIKISDNRFHNVLIGDTQKDFNKLILKVQDLGISPNNVFTVVNGVEDFKNFKKLKK
jgi:hypothetical protein